MQGVDRERAGGVEHGAVDGLALPIGEVEELAGRAGRHETVHPPSGEPQDVRSQPPEIDATSAVERGEGGDHEQHGIVSSR